MNIFQQLAMRAMEYQRAQQQRQAEADGRARDETGAVIVPRRSLPAYLNLGSDAYPEVPRAAAGLEYNRQTPVAPVNGQNFPAYVRPPNEELPTQAGPSPQRYGIPPEVMAQIQAINPPTPTADIGPPPRTHVPVPDSYAQIQERQRQMYLNSPEVTPMAQADMVTPNPTQQETLQQQQIPALETPQPRTQVGGNFIPPTNLPPNFAANAPRPQVPQAPAPAPVQMAQAAPQQAAPQPRLPIPRIPIFRAPPPAPVQAPAPQPTPVQVAAAPQAPRPAEGGPMIPARPRIFRAPQQPQGPLIAQSPVPFAPELMGDPFNQDYVPPPIGEPPAAPAPTDVRAPAPKPAQVPVGQPKPAVPAPTPKLGEQLPPILKEQLLQEAVRISMERRRAAQPAA